MRAGIHSGLRSPRGSGWWWGVSDVSHIVNLEHHPNGWTRYVCTCGRRSKVFGFAGQAERAANDHVRAFGGPAVADPVSDETRWTIETEAMMADLSSWQDPWEGGRKQLDALADAGLLLPPGGAARTRWRSHDLDSGGSIECSTREQAERMINREPDPFGPNHRCVLEKATRTTWADGSILIGAWTEVTE